MQGEAPKRIPDFASIEEEAEFWDTHDSAEYEHEFESVEFVVSPHLKSVRLPTLKIDMNVFNELRTYAEADGISPSTLAERWILEALARTRSEKAG